MMTEEQKRKLIILKSAGRESRNKRQWSKNALLQECLDALGAYRVVDDKTEIARILEIANGPGVVQIKHSAEPTLQSNHTFYVVWDEAQVPIIECGGADILAHWDDVIAVAFDTCFIDKCDMRAVLVRG